MRIVHLAGILLALVVAAAFHGPLQATLAPLGSESPRGVTSSTAPTMPAGPPPTRGGGGGVTAVDGHLIGFGVSIQLPTAWDGRVSYDRTNLGPVVLLANVPLPTLGTNLFHAAMRQLKPGDAMVVLQEFIGVCPCRGFEAASLPILIDERDFRTDPGVPRAHAFADRAVLLGERAFYLWAEFGDRDPTSTLTAANEALDSIELLPSSDRGPGYLAVPLMVEPPVFQPLPGWTTLSSGPFLSGDEDIPVTWATNQPISEVDLACSALAQTLCFPSESLSALAEDGIFIVASLPLSTSAEY